MKIPKSVNIFNNNYLGTLEIKIAIDDDYGYLIYDKNLSVIFRLYKPQREHGYSNGWKFNVVDFRDTSNPNGSEKVYNDIGNICSAIKCIKNTDTFKNILKNKTNQNG